MSLLHSLRSFGKNPAFTITATLTLALGIGATTAIFSVVNAVLLRPLPYGDANRLTIITSDMVARDVKDFPIAPGDIVQMREGGTLFSGIAALTTFRFPTVDEQGNTEVIRGANVTTNLLTVLGEHVVAGRDFTDADGTPPQITLGPDGRPLPPTTPPPPMAAILGYGYWQRRFGGDRSVVGTIVSIGPAHAEVIGIAPPELELLFPPSFHVERHPDVYAAARINWAAASHINVVFRVVARMKPGVRVAAAQAQMNTVAADLKRLVPIKQTAGMRLRVVPMHQEIVSDVRPAVLALMGGVTFVLLIACANVANLLLVRASRQERELAVRAALGGNRRRLIQQMLVEALMLALGGAALGVGLAFVGVKLVLALGPHDLPTIGPVTIDLTVLGFTVLAAVAAAAVFGVVPAVRASRPDIVGVLRSSGRTSELGAGRALRSGVVMAEVALAFVLLVGSGLMLRSFYVLTRANPGFDAAGLLTFTAGPARPATPEAAAAARRLLQQRLAALPGVTGATNGAPIPFSGQSPMARWGTGAAVNDPAAFREADLGVVMPGFFKVMGTRLIAGRTFTEADDAPTSTSVIVDRVLAARAFPGQSAVGKRLYVRYRSNEPEWVDVIGVVDQIRRDSPAMDGPEQMYVTNGEIGFGPGTWFVRAARDPASLAATVRAAVAAVDPMIPVMDLKTMRAYIADARGPTRFALALVGSFAAIALLLAGVGLYGVLSTIVRQRTTEIGVRMALGAPEARIFRQMIGEGMRLGLIGLGLGLAAALALTRAMRSMLVGVAPTDPATFVAIAIAFLAISALSCWLPARRAAALEPARALREE